MPRRDWNKLPEITHAEVLRRMQREIERLGGQANAAREWKISEPLLTYILKGTRNVGPKLLRALKLQRITLTLHRYAEMPRTANRRVFIRKPARSTDRFDV